MDPFSREVNQKRSIDATRGSSKIGRSCQVLPPSVVRSRKGSRGVLCRFPPEIQPFSKSMNCISSRPAKRMRGCGSSRSFRRLPSRAKSVKSGGRLCRFPATKPLSPTASTLFNSRNTGHGSCSGQPPGWRPGDRLPVIRTPRGRASPREPEQRNQRRKRTNHRFMLPDRLLLHHKKSCSNSAGNSQT